MRCGLEIGGLKLATSLVLVLTALAQGLSVHAASVAGKIIIAHAAMNARVAPLWIAQEQGFFAKNGLATNAIFIRQAPILVVALTAGDVQVGYTGGTSAMAAAIGGADLKLVATLTNWLNYDLVAAPSIKSAPDLRGKRFGVQSLAGTVWMAGLLGLEHLGLEPRRDNINILAVGDQTVLTQALEAGQIDATVLDGVFSRRLRQKGFTVLAELQQAKIPFSGQGVVVRTGYLQEHRDTVEAVLKGLLEGIAFSLAPKNKGVVVEAIARRLKLSDAAAVEEGYQDVIRNTEKRPFPNLDGLRNIQRLMKIRTASADKMKVEEMVDERILRRLDESGFIDKLHSAYGVK